MQEGEGPKAGARQGQVREAQARRSSEGGAVMSVREHGFRRLLMAAAVTAVLAGADGEAASAAPMTEINAIANTSAAPGSTYRYFVTLTNVGDTPTPDEDENSVADDPRVLTVTLPAGVTATSASAFQWDCSATDFSPPPPTVSCMSTSVLHPSTNRGTLALKVDTV